MSMVGPCSRHSTWSWRRPRLTPNHGCTSQRCVPLCIFQLRHLRRILRSLSTDAAKTLVHAFISTRLESGLLQLTFVRHYRQLVLTPTSRSKCCGVRRYEHHHANFWLLRQLHWLPVRQRVDFKPGVLVFKALHGTAQPYLAEDCELIVTTDVACCGLRQSTHVRSSGQVHVLAIVPLLPPVRDSGTVCQYICGSRM